MAVTCRLDPINTKIPSSHKQKMNEYLPLVEGKYGTLNTDEKSESWISDLPLQKSFADRREFFFFSFKKDKLRGIFHASTSTWPGPAYNAFQTLLL